MADCTTEVGRIEGSLPGLMEYLLNPAFLQALKADLAQAGEALVAAYKLQGDFFVELFDGVLQRGTVDLISDYRQRPVVEDLAKRYPSLRAWIWPDDRMYHCKVILLPKQQVAYVGSHNLTRYAASVGQNATLRVCSPRVCQLIERRFREQAARCDVVQFL
jgi:hypothetical protein